MYMKTKLKKYERFDIIYTYLNSSVFVNFSVIFHSEHETVYKTISTRYYESYERFEL